MNLTTFTHFILRHKLAVVLFWIIVTAVGVSSVSSATGALSQRFTGPDSESETVNTILLREYGNGGRADPLVPVITLPAGTTVDSPGIKQQLAAAFDKIAAAAPSARVVSYASTGDRLFVSDDGRTTYGLVFPVPARGQGPAPAAAAVKTALANVNIAGAQFHVTGVTELQAATEDQSSSGGGGTFAETAFGAIAALLVLAWVFGSFLAVVPILIALIAIITTFLLVWGMTTLTPVNFVVQYLIALIGLGVAIDYSLLIVTRWREERAAGLSNQDAVIRATALAGHAVIFSGITVAIGLVALAVLPIPFMRSIGIAGMLIPLVSVVVAITLLPVILATIGPRLDWPRLRSGNQVSRFWERWARLVTRKHWVSALAGLAILAVLVVPLFALNLGQPDPNAVAQTGDAHQAATALEQSGIGNGPLVPFEVLVQGADSDPAQVAATLSNSDHMLGAIAPAGPSWQRNGSTVVVAIPRIGSDLGSTRSILASARGAVDNLPGQVRIGGAAASAADFISVVYGDFPLMVALIVVVTFIFLLRAFRSVTLPLKAVILNGLSIAAAYGVMVFVWQMGYGSHLIWGIVSTGSITSWVPLMVFAFVFGLSMDYEVFILTRMREEYDATGSTNEAVVRGISHTGKLVTTAAVILFLAFVSMSFVPNTEIKILATGLGVGILLDATITRALLVPSIVSLMGHWNWWVPSWLQWFTGRQQPTQPAPQPALVTRDEVAD